MIGRPVAHPRQSVRFGDLAERARHSVEVDSASTYLEIGIRSHGRGVFHKEPVLGAQLGGKSVFRVEPGCLVFNIVFAWEGAVAITSPADDGRIASHRFPMFRIRDDRADIEFLRLFLTSKRGRHLLQLASPGGAGRNRTLNLAELVDTRIPLPALSAQRSIGNFSINIDRHRAVLERQFELRQRLKRALHQLLLTGKWRLRAFVHEPWTRARLGDVAVVNPPLGPTPRADSFVSFVPMSAVMEGGGLRLRDERRFAEVSKGYTSFRDGDVLLAKITPCFENGKGALAHGLTNGVGCGSTELHVVRSGPRLHSGFLHHLTHLGRFRRAGISCMTGSAGQRRVPAEFVEQYPASLPPLPEQAAISQTLDLLDRELSLLDGQLDAVRRLKRGLMQKLLTGEIEVPKSREPRPAHAARK